jgi:hypothetical protein
MIRMNSKNNTTRAEVTLRASHGGICVHRHVTVRQYDGRLSHNKGGCFPISKKGVEIFRTNRNRHSSTFGSRVVALAYPLWMTRRHSHCLLKTEKEQRMQ